MRDRMDRRSFFGVAARGIVAGIVGAELSMPLRALAIEAVENQGISVTGKPENDQVQLSQNQPQSCPDPRNDFYQQCKKPINASFDKIADVAWQVGREELPARVFPSLIVSKRDGRPNPIMDTLAGTGETGLSRREITFLIFGSLVFGLAHNIGFNGQIDTKSIPASQTVGGMVYWLLQRKFGISANFMSHFWFNFRQGAYR